MFLTEDGLVQFTNWLNVSPDDLSQLRNTWTLAGGAAIPFRAGQVQTLPDYFWQNLQRPRAKHMLGK